MTEIAEKLQAAMREKNLSYGELATLTKIPKSAIFRYVTGETEKIPLDRLEKMAATLGVSAAYLMGWEPEEMMNNFTISQEDELMEYLDMLRTRPECRILLSTVKGSTKEEVEANVRLIEALRGYKG